MLMYRDIGLAIDHAPDVAAPWALMVQYLLPFDAETAGAIWEAFVRRFVVLGPSGAHVEVVPESGAEDVRVTCLSVWLAREIGDDQLYEAVLEHVDSAYDPRVDDRRGEFAYWFHLDEPHPRGQWNNAVMNAFVAPAGTWSALMAGEDGGTTSTDAGPEARRP